MVLGEDNKQIRQNFPDNFRLLILNTLSHSCHLLFTKPIRTYYITQSFITFIMTLSYVLYEFVNQQSLNSFRSRELLLFHLGFAFNQLANLWTNANPTKPAKLTTQLHKIVDEIVNSNNKHSYIVSKPNLSLVFQTVLNSFQSEKETFQKLKLNFQQFIQLFLQILYEGFQITAQSSDFQSQNSPLQSQIHKAIQQKTEKIIVLKKKNDKKSKQEAGSFLQPKFAITQKETQIKGKTQDLCKICYCPLNISRQQILNQIEVFQVSQCKHKYHKNCIIKMIEHYMNQNSSIVAQIKEQGKLQAIQVQQDWPTLIKCPDYEQCSVLINFSQIHSVLLNNRNQKRLKCLQRLYSMAFNDYINCQRIMPFKKVRQFLSKELRDQGDHKSLTKDCLFFCLTNGCNGIYEVDRSLLQKSHNKDLADNSLENFTCIACHQSYCLKCFSLIHPTMSCKQLAISQSYLPEDRELQNFMKTLRRPYMKCPKCHFYVENWRGCSTITCRCGIRFCYKCGSTQCPYAKCLKQMAKQSKINGERQDQEK